MNQTCKVCGEPAAGFHFGAFTCEGCKSFFGRSYNNISSISECKNNGECIINKKNRTACKACRLRKCLLVGMSKSGSRYGRRSNWFKIHCLLQEQQQAAAAAASRGTQGGADHCNSNNQKTTSPPNTFSMLGHPGSYPLGFYPPRMKEDLIMLGFDDYNKHPVAAESPSVSSPDSHNSDSSVDIKIRGNSQVRVTGSKIDSQSHKDFFLPFSGFSALPAMPPPSFLPPHLLFPSYHPGLHQYHHGLLKPAIDLHPQHQHDLLTSPISNNKNSSQFVQSNLNAKKDSESRSSNFNNNNNNNSTPNSMKVAEEITKRFYLDAMLKSQYHSPMLGNTNLLSTTIGNSSKASPRHKSDDGVNEIDHFNKTSQIRSCEEKDDLKSDGGDDIQSNCDEDLIISVTPPKSPILNVAGSDDETESKAPTPFINNPIDLSMKSSKSSASSSSSRASSSSVDSRRLSINENEKNGNNRSSSMATDGNQTDDDTTTTTAVTVHKRINYSRINGSDNYNSSIELSEDELSDYDRSIKRLKMQITTTPLDLTTKV